MADHSRLLPPGLWTLNLLRPRGILKETHAVLAHLVVLLDASRPLDLTQDSG